MKAHFAVSLPIAEVAALSALRRWDDLEVCAATDCIWLRAGILEEDRWDRCRRLPGADRFTVLDDGQLLPVGLLVPRGRLPAGPWQSFTQWFQLALPPVETAAPPPAPAALQLVRSTAACEPAWLLTTLAAWKAYAVTAPQVRLARWSFVADRHGRVIVRGTPLPPLPGERFVEHDGIAVPVGWVWSPALPAEVIREAFAIERGTSLLWTSEGRCERISADDWVQAARSAVRLTAEELST